VHKKIWSKETLIGGISRRKFLDLLGKAGGSLIALPFFASPGYGAAKGNPPQVSVMPSIPKKLLKNGLIVDGTGRKGFMGNLLMVGEKIEKIQPGDIPFTGEVIDCTDKVIAPGIIDVHSHMDWYLPIQGHAELKIPFTAQGVTTFVAGNCGYGVAGFKKGNPYKNIIESSGIGAHKLFAIRWDTMEEYFDYLRRGKITHNLVNLAGHGTTRTSIRGFNPTPMKPEEMTDMLHLLEEAMDQGAFGVSLGLQYEPGVFATMDELTQVARLVQRKDKVLAVHLKAYSKLSGTYPLRPIIGKAHNLLAIEDMLNLARATGVRLQISHLIFVGSSTWKNYDEALSMIDAAIKDGIDVKFDTYAYNCGTSHINVFLPEWFLARVPQAYDDASAMRKLHMQATVILWLLGFGFEDIQITYANHPELNRFNGMFLADIAKERGMSPFDNFVDFARKSGGLARVLNHKYSNQEIVEALMRHPASLYMTDASVATEGVQNPACYGNFPRFLQFAREKKLLSLEEAVYKMSGGSAERYKIKDRGILKAGMAADIAVFDFGTIRDNNTRIETNKAPTGIDAVFINGVRVLAQGKVDESLNVGKVVL
jgi:N-acyl-D-amino-acid deacylase